MCNGCIMQVTKNTKSYWKWGISGSVKHQTNIYLLPAWPSRLSPGICPNPVKLITMRCFLTNGNTAIRYWVVHAELYASEQITDFFFLSFFPPVEKVAVSSHRESHCSLSLCLLFLGIRCREDLPFTTRKKVTLSVVFIETHTCRFPFIIGNFWLLFKDCIFTHPP